ncbi:response regulator [Tenacibaculum amylolyticum]|uniref:response regulator n=1 Tax=Tenacibaculum amylolyticum TaxID=104269 RepID=UPI003895EFBE
MQHKKYNALLIDDHPLIAEAYKSAFKFIEQQDEQISFYIQTAVDCDSACAILKEYASNSERLDVVFLDMRLPPSSDGTILSGEDLGLKIHELLPATKIIVSTTFNDNYRVHSILKNLNPEGFLVKNDLTPNELVQAIQEVLKDPPYYSKTVMKLLRNQISSDLLLDDIDRKILYEISIGTKTSALPDLVHLSIAAIEKRKRQLKKIFAINSTDDRELVLMAKDKGFI